MFDVKIMNPSHVDYEWFVSDGTFCALCHDDKTVYFSLPNHENYVLTEKTIVDAYDRTSKESFTVDFIDYISHCFSHETIHAVLRRLKENVANNKFNNVKMPKQYCYAGF